MAPFFTFNHLIVRHFTSCSVCGNLLIWFIVWLGYYLSTFMVSETPKCTVSFVSNIAVATLLFFQTLTRCENLSASFTSAYCSRSSFGTSKTFCFSIFFWNSILISDSFPSVVLSLEVCSLKRVRAVYLFANIAVESFMFFEMPVSTK